MTNKENATKLVEALLEDGESVTPDMQEFIQQAVGQSYKVTQQTLKGNTVYLVHPKSGHDFDHRIVVSEDGFRVDYGFSARINMPIKWFRQAKVETLEKAVGFLVKRLSKRTTGQVAPS